MTETSKPLLDVLDYHKWYPVGSRFFTNESRMVKAVDGVSFSINHGETLGLVGESGCGKTTIGKGILRLHEATAGSVLFEGQDLLAMDPTQLRLVRRNMQIIYQDPYSSLNPRMTVGDIIGEPLEIHRIANGEEKRAKVLQLMDTVGLSSSSYYRYPHEFSGGQRQRIGIARALCLNPKLIVCDEPVSALDVSIQSQILNLLEDLQKQFNLAYLFIAHGLVVVKHISDRIGVMYLGKLIELAESDTLFEDPHHPYTKALLSAIPVPDPSITKKRLLLKGEVPSALSVPNGCRFHTRCPFKMKICEEETPDFLPVNNHHYCACHLYRDYIVADEGKA